MKKITLLLFTFLIMFIGTICVKAEDYEYSDVASCIINAKYENTTIYNGKKACIKVITQPKENGNVSYPIVKVTCAAGFTEYEILTQSTSMDGKNIITQYGYGCSRVINNSSQI